MQRLAFPRLYVPPAEEVCPEPESTRLFQGRRSAFGPVTVYFTVDEERQLLSWHDWRGPDAEKLAADLLEAAGAYTDDREAWEEFAAEVLSHLPWDRWELPQDTVWKWYEGREERMEELKYPPRCSEDEDEELQGPEDEERMLELVRRLGRGGGKQETGADPE